jgi:hypothetical protein
MFDLSEDQNMIVSCKYLQSSDSDEATQTPNTEKFNLKKIWNSGEI